MEEYSDIHFILNRNEYDIYRIMDLFDTDYYFYLPLSIDINPNLFDCIKGREVEFKEGLNHLYSITLKSGRIIRGTFVVEFRADKGMIRISECYSPHCIRRDSCESYSVIVGLDRLEKVENSVGISEFTRTRIDYLLQVLGLGHE